MLYLVAKLLTAALLLGVSLCAAYSTEGDRGWIERLPGPGPLCSAYLVFRVAVLFCVIHVLHMKVPSDIPGYVEQGLAVLHGAIPWRDFASPYGFGFHYVLAVAVWVKPDPMSVMTAFQVGECLGLWLLLRAIRAASGDDIAWRRLFVLYAVNPLIVVSLWLGGQDESLLILVLGTAAVLVGARSQLAVVVLPAVLLSATKSLAVWILAPFARTRPLRQALLIGAVIGASFALLALVTHHGPQSFHFARQGGGSDDLAAMTTSGNLWHWYEQVAGRPAGALSMVFCLAALSVTAVWVYRFGQRMNPLHLLLLGTALLGLCFQLTYKMTFPPYLGPTVAATLSLLVLRRTSRRTFVGITVLSALAPYDMSYWYWLRTQPAPPAVASLGYDLTDIALIATTAFVFIRLLRESGVSLRYACTTGSVGPFKGLTARWLAWERTSTPRRSSSLE